MKSASLENIELVRSQVHKRTSEIIIKQIAIQLDRSDEAKRRVDEEGIVVRDMAGSVIPHPALKIEADACRLIHDLIQKNKKFDPAYDLK